MNMKKNPLFRIYPVIIFFLTAILYSSLIHSPLLFANEYKISPLPKWVKPHIYNEPREIPYDKISTGTYYLATDMQIKISDKNKEVYRHYAIKVINQTGIEDVSQILIDYDPAYQTVLLHNIKIHRQNNLITQLNPEQIRILNLEENLERQVLDGRKTVYIILEDIRENDVVEYDYSVNGSNPAFGDIFYQNYYTQWGVPVNSTYFRLIWPKERKLYIKNHREITKPFEKPGNDYTEYTILKENILPILADNGLPVWFNPYPWIQFSESGSWSDVAKMCTQLYRAKMDISPEIVKFVKEIKQTTDDPEDRLIQALRFVQDKIRYLGIEDGLNSYSPTAPSKVFQRRFGDCKDKAILLCTLLKELSFEAFPALVSTDYLHKVEEMLPSPYVFDHVIVNIKVDGKNYWVDPTQTHQRGTIDHLYSPRFRKALVLNDSSSNLVSIDSAGTSEPGKVINTKFDISKGWQEPAVITIESIFNGEDADYFRSDIDSQSREELQKSYLNYYAKEYPGIKVREPMTIKDDPINNTIVTNEYYSVDDFWEYLKENKKYKAYFKAQEIRGLLNEPDAIIRTMPYRLSYPLKYEQNIEIQLPERSWNLSPEKINIKNEYLSFQFEKEYKNNQLKYKYHYETLQDHVPQSSLSEYLDSLEKIKDILSHYLYYRDQPLKVTFRFDKIFSFIALFIIGTYSLISYSRIKKEFQFSNSFTHEENHELLKKKKLHIKIDFTVFSIISVLGFVAPFIWSINFDPAFLAAALAFVPLLYNRKYLNRYWLIPFASGYTYFLGARSIARPIARYFYGKHFVTAENILLLIIGLALIALAFFIYKKKRWAIIILVLFCLLASLAGIIATFTGEARFSQVKDSGLVSMFLLISLFLIILLIRDFRIKGADNYIYKKE